MDSQEEFSEVTVDQEDFDSETRTEFSPSPSHGLKTEDPVINLPVGMPRKAFRRYLDCLSEEDEDVDYPAPRPITGLPEPINVDDHIDTHIDKPRSNHQEISFAKIPCLQFTTEDIKNYLDHLQSKLDMLYQNLYEINRQLIATQTEQVDDKNRIRNQQHILDQQEEELIFYRKFYKTGKYLDNDQISEDSKQLQTPPKSEINKYAFGRKLIIETNPMDVDPDIKEVVDQRVQFVLQTHAKEHNSSPSPDHVITILHIDHSIEETEDKDFYPSKSTSPCVEEDIYDPPIEFQDRSPSPCLETVDALLQDKTCHEEIIDSAPLQDRTPSPYQESIIDDAPLRESTQSPRLEGSIDDVPLEFPSRDSLLRQFDPLGSGSSASSTSSQDIADIHLYAKKLDDFVEEVSIKFQDKEIIIEQKQELPRYELIDSKYPEKNGNPQSPEVAKIAEVDIVKSSDGQRKNSRSPSPKLKLLYPIHLSDEMMDLKQKVDYMYMENDGGTSLIINQSTQDTPSIANLMTSIKNNDCQLDYESAKEHERQLIAEIERYVGVEEMSDLNAVSQITRKVPYVSKCDSENFQLKVTADVKAKVEKMKKGARPLTASSKKRVKESAMDIGKRRYPLKPIYQSNSQKTILPPIKTKTHNQQTELTEKQPSLPDIEIKFMSENQGEQPSLPKLPIIHKPIIKSSNHNIASKRLTLPDIESTKPSLRKQMNTTILPDVLKPEHLSQNTISSAKRNLTKLASYQQPKVLLPVQPKLYQSNRRKERQPTKLPPICHLGLNHVFPPKKE